MANEKESFIPAIKQGFYRMSRETLIETAENLLTIVLSHPKTTKILTDVMQVTVNIGKPEAPKKAEAPATEPKPEPAKEPAKTQEKPVRKQVSRMSDQELASALAKELNKIPDEEELPEDNNNEEAYAGDDETGEMLK